MHFGFRETQKCKVRQRERPEIPVVAGLANRALPIGLVHVGPSSVECHVRVDERLHDILRGFLWCRDECGGALLGSSEWIVRSRLVAECVVGHSNVGERAVAKVAQDREPTPPQQ